MNIHDAKGWTKSNATAGGGSTQRFRELANGDTEWETTYPDGTVWFIRYTSDGLKVAEARYTAETGRRILEDLRETIR